jgi:predicted transcriptional regulator
MAGSAIDNELMQYFTQLDDQQKKSMPEMIKSFLNPPNKQPGIITIEAYNNELQEAEAEYDRGEYISHEEMRKQISKWEDNMK